MFIDETWAKTNMARTHGWAPRGERLRMAVPHGHWNTTTFLAGLSRRGMIAPFVLPGAIDRDAFETYLKLNFNSTDKKYLTTQRVTPALPSVPTTFP